MSISIGERPLPLRPQVLSAQRMARGLDRARRDPLTALRVAVIAHGRILSALDRRTRGLMWHGCRPRRFLPGARGGWPDHAKAAYDLAHWWHTHADQLDPNWGPRLLATIQAIAVDRWRFPQLPTVSWTAVTGMEFTFEEEPDFYQGRRTDLPWSFSQRPDDRNRYLARLRDFRMDLLEKAQRIEDTAKRLKAVQAEVCADALNGGAVSLLIGAAADEAERNCVIARELRMAAGLVVIHGLAGKDAESAARGNFARVLSFALNPVPRPLQMRFIALLLDDLNFGTGDTYRCVQSILRARSERSSN
ncbi:MAG: hypothetical protein JWO52_2559 [Gammaproteobacteria bacterium]|nr:hypothetical protein [Gammaproteobacteria bacterium]